MANLTKYDSARSALQQAIEIDELKDIRHKAQAMRQRLVPELDPIQSLSWYYPSFSDQPDALGHKGGDLGSNAYMFFDPKDETEIILVANGDWNWNTANKLMSYLFQQSLRF